MAVAIRNAALWAVASPPREGRYIYQKNKIVLTDEKGYYTLEFQPQIDVNLKKAYRRKLCLV